MLKQGDKGKEVRELQEKLLGLGYELKRYGPYGWERVQTPTVEGQAIVSEENL